MTKIKLIQALDQAIRNNSDIEGDKNDTLLFGEIDELSYDSNGLDVKFVGGGNFRISIYNN